MSVLVKECLQNLVVNGRVGIWDIHQSFFNLLYEKLIPLLRCFWHSAVCAKNKWMEMMDILPYIFTHGKWVDEWVSVCITCWWRYFRDVELLYVELFHNLWNDLFSLLFGTMLHTFKLEIISCAKRIVIFTETGVPIQYPAKFLVIQSCKIFKDLQMKRFDV